MMPERRTSRLINPKFQMSFLVYTLGIALLTGVIYYSAIYYFFWKFRILGSNVGLSHDHVFFKFLAQQQYTINWVWLVVSLVSVFVISLSGLILSHKVAGPLFKLHTHMKSVAEGKTLERISFRDGDYFLEIAQAYNEQLERLSKKGIE